MQLRATNLTGKHAQTVLDYTRKHGIQLTAKLERELERGVEMDMYLIDRNKATKEEKAKLDAWLMEQEDEG